jgi:hypothetical protein
MLLAIVTPHVFGLASAGSLGVESMLGKFF